MTTLGQPGQPAKPRKSRRSQDSQQPSAPEATGAEGLAVVPEATRGGEDVRRRGWFWHWNALVTQYAPLIGLKGVGLLNSYTVWTDRREESPHRGYAFPSQQSEADFYGEDRAELITINKILVALDLIEIRKEMVLRADPQGRRWKVPHNFYRVKDHGDDFTLSTADVLRVAELAERDRAVYRYVRRVFSPRFSPIDGDNVWGHILPEVRQTPVWQALAQRAAKEEDRASARTRAGHAARKGNDADTVSAESRTTTPFFVTNTSDDAANATVVNDSGSVNTPGDGKTSVASFNTGSTMGVAPTNTGSSVNRRSRVGGSNSGGATSVDPSNTTYHQPETTTKREQETELAATITGNAKTASPRSRPEVASAMTGGPAAQPPGDAAGHAAALRAFEHANDRTSTPAERKLLRDLAERFEPAAASIAENADVPRSGWGWLEAAVWEAVEAGSAFVAPRRLREILLRWERDGFPGAGMPNRDHDPDDEPEPTPPYDRPRRTSRSIEPTAPAAPILLPVTFTIAEVGLSNRQVWAAALAELAQRGEVSKADLQTWLHPASLIGREGDTLILAAPHAVARDRITARLLPAVRAALSATIGVRVEVAVVDEGSWGDRLIG